MRSKLTMLMVVLAVCSFAVAGEPAASGGAKRLWSLEPFQASAPAGSIDHFLPPEGREADKRALIRRLYFDLIGLPPSPGEVESFLTDERPDAYTRLVEKLLGDPRYGERQARIWLDLVRYAESDGYKSDVYRPEAWRYREYVVRAFNADKPYDLFLHEQLAGDEMFPDDPEARVATGYLRLWPYEDNQADVARQWEAILTDITDVTGEAILGLSFGCARCHDHKYDPILREDYYALRAFFAAIVPRTDLTSATAGQTAEYQHALVEWESSTAAIRAEIEAIERPAIEKKRAESIARYPAYLRAIFAKPDADRTPLERQYHYLAEVQNVQRTKDYAVLIPAEGKKRLAELKKQLVAYESSKPVAPRSVVGVTDIGPDAPPTCIPGREDDPIEPGLLKVLGEVGAPAPSAVKGKFAPPGGIGSKSTGRRATLARLLTDPTSPATPLVARVMVNRIWQQHFGDGLVATPNDFGHQGTPPAHPELLDWLARRFIESGWSVKELHRLIANSAAYGRAGRVRRLEAEQVRDAMLAVSGELDPTPSAEGVDSDSHRRSIYLKMLRNKPDPFLAPLDMPDMFTSCGRRSVTTTPLQSLMFINGEFTLKRAEAFAHRIRAGVSADPGALIDRAYRFAVARPPTSTELEAGFTLFAQSTDPDEALVDLGHVLFNSNAFIYLD